jgi:hypothetical protein
MNSAYIVNPETKKPIKIGGRVYNKLVKDGLLEDPNYELYDIESDDDEIITVEEDRVKSKTKKSKLGRAASASRAALRNSLRRRKPKQSKYEVDELSEQMNELYCSTTSDEDSTDFSE